MLSLGTSRGVGTPVALMQVRNRSCPSDIVFDGFTFFFRYIAFTHSCIRPIHSSIRHFYFFQPFQRRMLSFFHSSIYPLIVSSFRFVPSFSDSFIISSRELIHPSIHSSICVRIIDPSFHPSIILSFVFRCPDHHFLHSSFLEMHRLVSWTGGMGGGQAMAGNHHSSP